MRAAAGTAIGLALIPAIVLGGCGKGDDDGGGRMLHQLGKPEGALNLIALPGYVEDGARNPAIDWVTPFEKKTGCEVSDRVADSPREVIRLMRSGDYDGVSARGDVSLRL